MERFSIALLVSCLLTGCRFLENPNKNTEPTAEAVIEVEVKRKKQPESMPFRLFHLCYNKSIIAVRSCSS